MMLWWKDIPEDWRFSCIVIIYLKYESIPRNAPVDEVCYLSVHLDEAEFLQSPGGTCLQLGPFLADSLS